MRHPWAERCDSDTVPRPCPARDRLPWPAAALVILVAAGALWAGIGFLVLRLLT